MERLLIEAQAASDPFAEELRDSMMPFWEALTALERAALQARTGATPEEMNQTVIRDANGPISENRALVAYLVLERALMESEQRADPFVDDLRDALLPFWDAVGAEDRAALQARTGSAMDELNPTTIEELATHIVSVVPWIVGGSIAASLDIEGPATPRMTITLNDTLPVVSIDHPYGKVAA